MDNNVKIVNTNKKQNNIHYHNFALLTIGIFSLLSCIYYNITNSFSYLYNLIPIINFYAFVDLFYTTKLVTKLNNIFILVFIFYFNYFNYFVIECMDLKILVYTFIKTEISSISLVLTYYIDKKSIYYNLNSVIFYTLFFKLRIYDFYYNIIHYDSSLYIIINKYTPNNFYGKGLFVVSCYGLYFLNVYWFILLSKIVYKKVFY